MSLSERLGVVLVDKFKCSETPYSLIASWQMELFINKIWLFSLRNSGLFALLIYRTIIGRLELLFKQLSAIYDKLLGN